MQENMWARLRESHVRHDAGHVNLAHVFSCISVEVLVPDGCCLPVCLPDIEREVG